MERADEQHPVEDRTGLGRVFSGAIALAAAWPLAVPVNG
jgi:hypothetical protein